MKTSRDDPRKIILDRLKLIGAGLILGAVGRARLEAGVDVVRHGIGQPMFLWGLVAAGIVCFVLAFIPISWVARAAELPGPRNRSHR